jgi:hypothetical protein
MTLHKLVVLVSLVPAALSGLHAFGEERIRVRVPNETESQIEDLLNSLATAIRDEDFQAYSACFTKAAQTRYCTAVAADFVTYDLEFERGKWVLLDPSESRPVFLLRYAISKDGEPTWCVSTVECRLQGDRLVIAKETPQSVSPLRQRTVAASQSPLRMDALPNNCPDGRCRFQPVANKQLPIKDGKEILPGISMFNDEHGNPDPYGIMWLDPRQLWMRFPDKYGVPQCVRKELGLPPQR